ncbi:RipA family octameric membrane protein [Treponema berlinense]|uniref:RipA family octameric membrane protein n=1 Tax=Treponema berlinense TaxID=225004 RepID=UPI003FD7D170
MGRVIDEKKEFDNVFKYYEKAIEGRNFHYQNYNTWANYYSIFTGALFIAFYTLEKECKEFLFLKILIMLVGLVTSICWNLTVKGHYHWMLSWISVVQDYEKKLAKVLKKNKKQKLYVYSVYLNKGENFLNKNISSQKLTSKFTFFISLAWALLLVINLFSLFEKTLCIRT